jgi:hypothetical protein
MSAENSMIFTIFMYYFPNLMNSPEVKAFIRQHSALFCYIPEDKKEDISPDILEEFVFYYGDMKAFALGRGAKWKDYVDLFFILRDHYKIEEIGNEAVKNFGKLFLRSCFVSNSLFIKT